MTILSRSPAGILLIVLGTSSIYIRGCYKSYGELVLYTVRSII